MAPTQPRKVCDNSFLIEGCDYLTRPIVLVTGATGGIGASAVREIESVDGAQVISLSSSDFNLDEPSSIDKFFSEGAFSNLEGIVLCAGVNEPRSLVETDHDLWMRTMGINVLGHKRILDHVLPIMVRSGGGRIVAISSLYGRIARKGRWSYSSSKASLEALIRSVAIEYAEWGILANCVAPGFVATSLTTKNNTGTEIAELVRRIPLGRLAAPEEIAKVVRFLISQENTYITGQTIYIDGGISIS
jgi:3-oxoacyl-[acyl-carrier protein] reductase